MVLYYWVFVVTVVLDKIIGEEICHLFIVFWHVLNSFDVGCGVFVLVMASSCCKHLPLCSGIWDASCFDQ